MVTQGALGEFTVDFGEYGWFPSELPSESRQGEDEDENQDEDGSEEENTEQQASSA